MVDGILDLFDAGPGKRSKIMHAFVEAYVVHVRHEEEQRLEQTEELEDFENPADRSNQIAHILAGGQEAETVGELLKGQHCLGEAKCFAIEPKSRTVISPITSKA